MPTITLQRSLLCRGAGPTPGLHQLRPMLASISDELRTRGLKPFSVTVASWRAEPGHYLARIQVEACPGEFHQSFTAWFQWQHVCWDWSAEPQPVAA